MANFNVPPYYDDYDQDKQYYKILFRPSVAIQARELNQMQTMLQKQIERFGSHIFREGSIVLGGAFDLELDVFYIKALSIQPLASSLSSLVGKTVVGATTGITAVVRAAVYDEINNVYAILLRYTSSSVTSSVFLNDEAVTVSDDASLGFTVVPSTYENYTGTGSIFSVSQGVVFSKGYFLAFPAQTTVIEKYSADPTKSVGLQLTESFVTDLSDPSLADNALGSLNENAPGAHRYKIECLLTSIDYKTGYDNENFITFMDIQNGVIQASNERSQYARIYDELAKRTFDESGDYYVKGFEVRTREHLDTGSNEGLYTLSEGGDATKLSVDVGSGVAYVKGYEVSKITTQHVVIDKGTDYNDVNNQLVNARTGGYFFINEITGSVDHDEAFVVNLYLNAETRLTSEVTNLENSPATQKIIGTARMKAMIYESGVMGTPTAVMRAYLYDYTMNSGYILTDTKAIGSTTASNRFFADVVLASGKSIFYESNQNVLIFSTGASNIRSIRTSSGTVDTSFQFIRSEDKTANVANTSSLTTTVTTSLEALSYSTGTLSSAEKREIIVSLNANSLIQVPGTVSGGGSPGSFILTGVSTEFDKLSVGNRIRVNGNSYFINSITNSTSLTVTSNVSPSASANLVFKDLRAGDIIDLTANGSTGQTRTATVASGILTLDFKEVATNVVPTAVSAKISYRVDRTTAAEVKKILNPNRYVKLNTNISNSSGPYNLGLSDVYKIRSIRMDNTAFTTANGTANSTNVTSYFVLDNGQRDNLYDHGRLLFNGGISLANMHMLVELDHFTPDYSAGFGYFSVDSYPIDDVNTSNSTIFTYEIPKYISAAGTEYSLRDALDFRPVKQITATSATTVAAATTNPATTTSVIVDTDGLRLAAPDSDMSIDYSFYLPRKDVVTLDKNGLFNVIKGESGITPISPNVPENVMGVASVYIPPYPSLSETFARIINTPKIACISKKIANIRYTMREIGVLKNRIENLEYYNLLTLLEKKAIDLTVLNDQGLDRFKNGYFVDGFVDHSLGDTANPDYKIAVDKVEQIIRPFFKLDSFQYRIESSGSTNYQQSGNLITLPYTQVTLLENRNVTTTRNIEQSVFRYIGAMELSPEGDTWCDTTTVDKVIQYGNEIPIEETMTTEWGSWENYAVGYNVYDRNIWDRSGNPDPTKFQGTYSSYAAALRAGNKDKDGRYLIETFGSSERTGIVTTVTSQTNTQELGNFVTDVSVQPYIRPQVIRVYVKGLKANTRYYCFFDGENMSSYVVPGTIPANGNITQAVSFGAEGSEWRANGFGELLGYLRLPATGKRFRTGTKEIIVTDNPTNSIDATSYAKKYWSAMGISVQKQNTIISTQVAIIQQEEITEQRQLQKVEVMGPSCMAYSFKVDVPRGEEGIFLTSVDVWVSAKHANLGVWFEIREMNSGGSITRTQVPYSEVWLKNSDVTLWAGTSATEETGKTRVTFPCPVFLMNNTQYAFVIHTEGLNPDYYFWISRLGETDVLTKKPVTSRQLTGTVFTTNNNLNYDMVPDIDLKVRFNRAQFTVGTATLIMGNRATEFINLSTASGDFSRKGEPVISSEFMNFSSTTSGANSIALTDIIRGVTSGTSANVIGITGINYYVDYYGFTADETFNVFNSANTSKSISGRILSIDKGSGTLRSYDSVSNFMIIDDSNGKFYSNAVIFGANSGHTGRISSFDQFKYSTTTLKPYYLVFNNTTLTFEKAGWLSNSSLNDFDSYIGTSMWYPGTSDSYSSFNNEVTVLSRVNELAAFGSSSPNSSARVRSRLTTVSEYVSPVIDISKSQSIYVHNIINNDDTGEANSSGGNLLNKYISKPVTLADGQEAEDLLVKLTAYKPPGSDVKVWMKLRHDDDSAIFRENKWIEMDYANNLFSSEANKNNFIELDYTIPASYKNEDGVVQYIKRATNIYANNLWSNASGSYGINAAANSILIPSADSIFAANDEVYYSVPPGGVVISGTYTNSSGGTSYVEANTYLYINSVNTTAITLKAANGATTLTSNFSNVDIIDFRTDATAEVHTIGGDVFVGIKQFGVKVGLKGTNSAKPARVGDLRVIALQL